MTGGRRLLALLAGAALAACSPGDGSPDDAASSGLEAVLSDRRVAPLFQDCGATKGRFYDRDTSDPVAFLVEKLAFGEQEPLQRAKEELGTLGEDAMQAVRRFFEQHASDPFGSPYLENAIDAAGFSHAPGARTILLAGVQQPQESVRLRAVLTLAKGHAEMEDYDLLLTHLDLERGDTQVAFAKALHDVDPARAEAEYLGWLARGEREPLWRHVLPAVSASELPATWASAAELVDGAPAAVRAWLLAAAAHAEPERFGRLLEEELHQENAERRGLAVRAAAAGGHIELLGEILHDEPEPLLRGVALEGLVEHAAGDERTLAWLREALDEPDPSVRGKALEALVQLGEPMAVDRALNELDQRAFQVQEGLDSLRYALASDEDLARRALEILETRLLLEEDLPPGERLVTYRAIGIVPLERAARLLREAGLALEGVELEGLRAHRWLMIQAINTGEPGQAYLFRELATEEDPLRRLDLLHAASSARTDEARMRLRSFLVDAGYRSAAELVFASSQLCRLGPGSEVAPLLKRLSYEVEDLDARRALQCLLWRWY